MCESRREELEFLYFCDFRDSYVNPKKWRAGFCVNSVRKSSNLFFCDLKDICLNPKESSSVFCVSPGISV